MRKYIPALVLFILLFSFVTAVSAADANNTQDLTDSTTLSQDNSATAKESIATPKVDKKDNKKTTKKETKYDEGDDCCSAIIQGYNNDSTISFRRDSTATMTLNVTHNSTYIRQNKATGSYFFHVLVSNNGWLVGSGGTDAADTSRGIEKNARSIISNNNLNNATFDKIVALKMNSAKGHVVMKAPNGSYALFIKYYEKTYRETGVLQAGQFLSVPNNPIYFVKGKYQNYTKSKYFIESSKLIAAKDLYGIERRNIMTYYYKRTNSTSNVKIYASNDDGRYVNRTTSQYVDSVRTNTRFIPSSQIPTLEGWAYIDDVNFTVKDKLTVKSTNVKTKTNKMTLYANVTDEFGKPVNTGKVYVVVNGTILKNSKGKVVYAKVNNGLAKITYTIKNIWKTKSLKYYFKYVSNSRYYGKTGNRATITVNNVVSLKNVHAATAVAGTNLTITERVTYSSNKAKVTGGKVTFKINDVVLKNEKGKTISVNVKNGVAKYNLVLNDSYDAKKYKITAVYTNGVQKVQKVSYVTLNRIAANITSASVNVRNNVAKVRGFIVDSEDNKVDYNTNITVKINNKVLKDAEGNVMKFIADTGTFDFNFTLPASYKKGYHNLTLTSEEVGQMTSARADLVMRIV